MLSASKLRNGVTYEENGVPYRVMDYQHKHLSRGSGTIKLKVRDLTSGKLLAKTYKSGDSVQDILVERKELQYLYHDDDGYYFMDPSTFAQMEMPSSVIESGAAYLREGENVWILFWDERALDLDLPPKVNMKIIECDPGEKGNSTSNVYKDAMVEGGLKVRVPLFINLGDKVRIDTRTGSYVERV